MTEIPHLTPREALLHALAVFEIPIREDRGHLIEVGIDYSIEIEPNGLYKLRSDGSVIAPFSDLEELCMFIRMG